MEKTYYEIDGILVTMEKGLLNDLTCSFSFSGKTYASKIPLTKEWNPEEAEKTLISSAQKTIILEIRKIDLSAESFIKMNRQAYFERFDPKKLSNPLIVGKIVAMHISDLGPAFLLDENGILYQAEFITIAGKAQIDTMRAIPIPQFIKPEE